MKTLAHSIFKNRIAPVPTHLWRSLSIAAGDFTTTWDGEQCPPITRTILLQWPNCGKEVKHGYVTNCIKFMIS